MTVLPERDLTVFLISATIRLLFPDTHNLLAGFHGEHKNFKKKQQRDTFFNLEFV